MSDPAPTPSDPTIDRTASPGGVPTIISAGTPATIGPFRIVREIGRGGMGVVYLAQDSRLDRLVAIKTIIPEVANDPGRLAMFRDEARLIAQMNHPHIAQIHQLVEDEGRLFLVMEYLPGRSLREAVRSGISPGDGVALLAQVADALEAAHQRRIVHRDLKPENVRLTDDGTAKLLDFGLAQALSAPTLTRSPEIARPANPASWSASAGAAQTRSVGGAHPGVVGTPGYMAPEQCRGEAVDARADVFAFGCLMYECLCGQPAFSGGTTGALIHATLTTAPDMGRLPRSLRPDIVELVAHCLVGNLDDRRPNLAGVANLLRGQPTDTGERPGVATANNLPRDTDAFVGRTAEIATLTDLVQQHPIVTLTGAGGCGKTRLAADLGRRSLMRFSAGVWLVELAPVGDGELVPAAVASALGLKSDPSQSPATAIAKHFGQNAALLILDNCEHVLAGAGYLASSLIAACPNLRIVATSREALGVAEERAWRVPGLAVPMVNQAQGTVELGTGPSSTPTFDSSPSRPGAGASDQDLLGCESVALFVDRAKAVRPGFQPTTEGLRCIARMCWRLDGLPLAIELAAARIKTLSPSEIESRLDQRLRMLRAGKGKAERHQTLRATVDWSYRLLSSDEKRAIRRLSVFAGGCTLEAAAAVIYGDDADDITALDMITQLIDKSLLLAEVHGEATRYRMLETIRQYGLEELDREGEATDAYSAHLRYMAGFATRWGQLSEGPRAGEALRMLAAEHDNFGAAIANASLVNGGDHARRICAALNREWQTRGCFSFGEQACRHALTIPANDARAEAGALFTATGIARRLSKTADARAYGEKTLAIARREHLPDLEAGAAALLAVVALDAGELDLATTHAEHALRLATESNNHLVSARSHNTLGITRLYLRDFAAAREHFESGLAIARRIGNGVVEATFLINLGNVASQAGEYLQAFDRYRDGLRLARELGDAVGFPYFMEHAGMLASAMGRHDRAAWFFGAAAGTRERAGMPAPKSQLSELAPYMEATRNALGSNGFDAAWQQGAALQTDDAVQQTYQWFEAGAASPLAGV